MTQRQPGSVEEKYRHIESRLGEATTKDRHRIRARLRHLKSKPHGSKRTLTLHKELTRIEQQLRASVKQRAWRRTHRPQCDDIPDLPITRKKDAIIRAIEEHPVVIIAGETGSGKSTQLPKFCLSAGRGVDGLIGCTQPRRIAATSIARRIADELHGPLGKDVGYKIRFKDRTPRNAYIKVMTDGILLAEAQTDRWLTAYDTIIVDEAHERSLNIDFVLGLLKDLLLKRDDLKIIITSATIDTEKFSTAFDHAPVIEVSGRMYPVEVQYYLDDTTSSKSNGSENDEPSHIDMAVAAVEEIVISHTAGDVLVFMPTEQDIRDTCDMLIGRNLRHTRILPLFARLSTTDQAKIFARTQQRKVIVATNIAETSLTIPGIKYVVDSGLARISRYNPRSRTSGLPIVPISQSSADQRKGRCGRVAKGVCVRLYSEKDYDRRAEYTVPEILRANLAEVILRMLALGLGDIDSFPFIDPPAEKRIKDGFELLEELGAITKSKSKRPGRVYRLSDKGRLMAKIPLDPRLSCILLAAQKRSCLNTVAIIAAAISIQDPRERPMEKAQQVDRVQAQFNHPASDFLTLVNLWRRYHEHWKQVKTQNQMRKYCRNHFLSFWRMREWRDIYHQIRSLCQELDMECDNWVLTGDDDGEYERLHTAILSGLLSNVAVCKDNNIYQAAKGREAMIFPGSGLFGKAGNWIVASEMVETNRLYARMVANIQPKWIERVGKDLCTYTYLQPRWEPKREQVMATEQVRLFGLIVDPGRNVAYRHINPEQAADIFIQHALVEGELKEPLPFMRHNQQLVEDIRNQEDRIRKRDILVAEPVIFQFYKDRIQHTADLRSLRRLINQEGDDHFLRMQREDLLQYVPSEELLEQFPEQLSLGNQTLQCQYTFDPGGDKDGITLRVPATLAPKIPVAKTDWLVPGLLKEKITALIKGLPKTYRKKLVPIPNTVDQIHRHLQPTSEPLINALGNHIHRHFGVDIPATAWPQQTLPDHLKMRFAVTGPDGKEIRGGRDKGVLSPSAAEPTLPDEVFALKRKWEQTGITRWDFGDLPDELTIMLDTGARWTVYPALTSESGPPEVIALRLFQNMKQAASSHQAGVAALLTQYLTKDLKFLKKSMRLPTTLESAAVHFGGSRQIEKDLVKRVVRQLFYRNLRSQTAFHACVDEIKKQILTTGQAHLEAVCPVVEAYGATRSQFHQLRHTDPTHHLLHQFLDELADALTHLVPSNFIELYNDRQLTHLPRYLNAYAIRAQRAAVDLEKDHQKDTVVKPFVDALNRMLKHLEPGASDKKKRALEDFYWLIEEFKVSVFAQELKTAVPVSQKRLEKHQKEIERMV